ncbi:hypothetical protein K1719_003246 [Acacia pycnantha]|nr:hypothetical protein K1719_003246 [Acacia pycnantha]
MSMCHASLEISLRDQILPQLQLLQPNDGNKVSGSFTSKAYKTIIKELQQKFGRPFEKEKVKSCWKLVNRRFSKCYDLFKNGFAWDPTTKQWYVEPEVWQKLIEAKLEAKEWMGKTLETKGQEVGNENEVTSPKVQDTRSQDVKSKRAKRSKDEEVEGIKVALRDIAGALGEGNAIYEKVKQKLPIPEAEIWKLLEDLKIQRQLFTRVYLYLLYNLERIRAVIGCSLNKRKELLLEMVFGPMGPSRYGTQQVLNPVFQFDHMHKATAYISVLSLLQQLYYDP